MVVVVVEVVDVVLVDPVVVVNVVVVVVLVVDVVLLVVLGIRSFFTPRASTFYWDLNVGVVLKPHWTKRVRCYKASHGNLTCQKISGSIGD